MGCVQLWDENEFIWSPRFFCIFKCSDKPMKPNRSPPFCLYTCMKEPREIYSLCIFRVMEKKSFSVCLEDSKNDLRKQQSFGIFCFDAGMNESSNHSLSAYFFYCLLLFTCRLNEPKKNLSAFFCQYTKVVARGWWRSTPGESQVHFLCVFKFLGVKKEIRPLVRRRPEYIIFLFVYTFKNEPRKWPNLNEDSTTVVTVSIPRDPLVSS